MKFYEIFKNNFSIEYLWWMLLLLQNINLGILYSNPILSTVYTK